MAIMDKTGKVVVPPQYLETYDFAEGMGALLIAEEFKVERRVGREGARRRSTDISTPKGSLPSRWTPFSRMTSFAPGPVL